VQFGQCRPEAHGLFGAVSISQAHHDASRGLIATYLSTASRMSILVEPCMGRSGAKGFLDRHRPAPAT